MRKEEGTRKGDEGKRMKNGGRSIYDDGCRNMDVGRGNTENEECCWKDWDCGPVKHCVGRTELEVHFMLVLEHDF